MRAHCETVKQLKEKLEAAGNGTAKLCHRHAGRHRGAASGRISMWREGAGFEVTGCWMSRLQRMPCIRSKTV